MRFDRCSEITRACISNADFYDRSSVRARVAFSRDSSRKIFISQRCSDALGAGLVQVNHQ